MAKNIVARWQTRPCEITGYALPMYCIWHCWADNNTKALVEDGRGYVELVDATRIRFLDSRRAFAQYDWRENETTSST